MFTHRSHLDPAQEFYHQLWASQIGTVQLRPLERQTMRMGLEVAVAFHLLLLLAYFLTLWLSPVEKFEGRVFYIDASDLIPPHLLQNQVQPMQLNVALPTTPQLDLRPIPVEDKDVLEVKTIISQDEYNAVNPAVGSGSGESLVVSLPIDHGAIPESFVPYEQAPRLIPGQCPRPAYPEMARRTGLSGTVKVKIWVDKKGNVGRVDILKVDPPGFGFEEAVTRTLSGWKFEPAIQNNEPIGVWIYYPVKFSTGE